MVDTILLKEIIRESGYKSRFIAEKVGISYQALLNKINNLTDFKAPEIAALCGLLKISPEMRDKIFFAYGVTENGNTVG